MNETDNHGQSRIPYHQNSYIYHTASLDSAVRAHNLMFWHEAVKGDYANLEQFCYMNRLSRPVQEMLRSLTKSQISRLVNPVMLDFRLDFWSFPHQSCTSVPCYADWFCIGMALLAY